MSLVTILWSMGAAAALTLAAVYGAAWLFERRLLPYLFFSIHAIAIALCARGELGMMHSETPAEIGEWIQRYYVALFFAVVSLVLFVWSYLGTGRRWLLWTIISMRTITLVVNLSVEPNFMFREITSLSHVSFLGEQVSIVGDAVLRPWVWFGRPSLLLAFLFMFDAAVASWRRADSDSRRKAVVVLLAVLGPSLISDLLAETALTRSARIPYLDTPTFLVTLLIMALELGRDLMMSIRTRLELADLRANLVQVGRVSILGQLASAIAHELNQPLSVILRNTEIAELDLQTDKPEIEELRAIVTDTGKAVRRAREIIDRMRALIKQRSIEMRPLVMDDLVQDVLALTRAEAASKEVLLSYDTEAGLPTVSGDRVHISQVLLNLIVNGIEAVQASPVGDRRIVIEARTEGRQVEIAVCDSGPGIPTPNLERIFEPLYSTKSGGLGMGLAICRTIVEAHSGRLWAEHGREGSGATLRFSLPRAKEVVA